MLTNVGDGKFKIGPFSHFKGKNIFEKKTRKKKKKENRKEKNNSKNLRELNVAIS